MCMEAVLDRPHVEIINKTDLWKQEKPTPEEVRNDNEKLKKLILMKTVEMYDRKGLPLPDRPDGKDTFLVHIWQVPLVAKHLALNQKGIPEADRLQDAQKAIQEAFMHDMGRIYDIGTYDTDQYNGNAHPFNGRDELLSLGFDPEIALLHHQWGLGPKDTMGVDWRAILQRLSYQRTADLYTTKYAKEKVFTVMADVAKTYTDPHSRNMPSIAPHTTKGAEALIQRQLQIGTFKEGDERYNSEMNGIHFMSALIDTSNRKFGLNYKKALADAQTEWVQAGHGLDELRNLYRQTVSLYNQTKPSNFVPKETTETLTKENQQTSMVAA